MGKRHHYHKISDHLIYRCNQWQINDEILVNASISTSLRQILSFFKQLLPNLLQKLQYLDKQDHRDEAAKKTKQIKKSQAKKRGKHKNKQENGSNQNPLETQEMPKKPLTAYIIYFQQKKPSFVQRYQSLNLSELTKLIAKQWKQITEEQRKPYLDRASQDRKRYDQQMVQFKKKHGADLESNSKEEREIQINNEIAEEEQDGQKKAIQKIDSEEE